MCHVGRVEVIYRMDVVSGPRVYLVSRPSVDWEQVAAFLEDEGVPPVPESIRAGVDESAAVIEISARLCYMSYGRGRRDIEDFINNLLASKDGSVFEHVNYGFVFTGVSRSLTHELVRHRAGFAYSQRSQRYVDESDGSFVVPPAIAGEGGGGEEALRIFTEAVDDAAASYDRLAHALDKAFPREMFESVRDRRKDNPPGSQGGAAKCHGDEDIRYGQRARLAPLHRDACGGHRGLGDKELGAHRPGNPPA